MREPRARRRQRHGGRRPSLARTLLAPAALAFSSLSTVVGAGVANQGTASASASASPPPGAGSSWPLYGRDLSNTRDNPHDRLLTPRTVGRLVPRWSKSGLVGVVGTPVVSGHEAYFDDLQGTLWAVDVASGRTSWQAKLAAGAVAAPAVGEKLLYTASGSTLYAVDRRNGGIVWRATTNPNPYAQISASPVVVDHEVLVGTASFEVMIRSTRYTFQGSIAAYDASTGRRLWNFVTTPNDASSGAGEGVWSTPAVDRRLGLLYVGTGQNLAPPPGRLEDSILALHLRTGKLAWSMQATRDDVFSAGYPNGFDYDFGASPNLFSVHGRMLVGDGDKGGTYYALDARTGRRVWQARLSPGGHFGGILGSAALADGRLLVPANQGDASPEASSVVAVNPANGRIEWRHHLAGNILGPVSAAGGSAFVSSDSGAMVILDGRTGGRRWSHQAPAPAACGPSITGGTVLWGYGFTLFEGPGPGGIIGFGLGRGQRPPS